MKALFLGLGGVGQRHLRNFLQVVPNATLAAVRHSDRTFEIGYDLQPDYSVNIMEKYSIVRFDSLERGIAWQPDCVIISSPTSVHMEQTLACVRAGIPVFLEKPISSSEDGLENLLDLVIQKNVPVMIGYMFRFHPGVQRFMELVDRQSVGQLLSMHVQLNSYMPSWHSYEKYNEFYAGRKDLGGGAVLSEIHELDLVAAMFGMPKNIWSTGGKLSSLDLDVEDTACSLLEFEQDGQLFPATVQMSFVQRPPTRTITIYGAEGFIRWDGMKNLVSIHCADGKETQEDFSYFERNEMFVEEIKHFIDCIQRGQCPRTNLTEVIAGHRLGLRIRDGISLKENT